MGDIHTFAWAVLLLAASTGAQAERQRSRLGPEIVGLAESQPVWAAQQVVPRAKPVPGQSYTVREGETLNGIAIRSGAGAAAIARANKLTPPYAIRAGQRLSIPAGRYHTVAAGETGIGIALAYGVPWSRILDLNLLDGPFSLQTGQRLLLPPDTPRKPRSLQERAAAFHIDIDDILTGGQPATAQGAPVAPARKDSRPLPSGMPIAEPQRFAGSFAWPIDGPLLSRFGPGASGERNDGIDIATPRDTPIKAAANGVVAYAGNQVGVFGGLILVTHGGGWVTAYGHAGRVDVVRGQKVTKGQVIGLSGDTGYASRPKLHFEIRRNRTPVDPLAQLPPRKGRTPTP